MSKRGDFTDFRQGDLLVGRPMKPDAILYLEQPNRYAASQNRPYRSASFSVDQAVVLVLSTQKVRRQAFDDSVVLVSDFRRKILIYGWMSNYSLMNDFWVT